MTDNVIAQGDRSFAVGGDVINSIIVTGDHNRFFIGDYVRLKDAYIEPWPVFERANLAHFVGREWLLTEVDAFLRDCDRGYFVLEAEAGLGKTTFLAWLVKQRGYVHHFVELARGQEGVGTGLKNLGAQIVLANHLKAWEAEGVVPGVAARPDYLARLLKLAAEQRQDGEKVVLVVDALDEAGAPLGQNVLGLPTVLPEGVYVIVSQRPVAVRLQVDAASTPRRVLSLAAGSTENQADIRRYLEDVATWPGIARILHESGYSSAQFATTLLEKCRGLWIYLHYVVNEIENGERTPLELDNLPAGMTQYYASYWRQWRDQDEMTWYGAYLPLLATLAAAQEAVSAERLLAWTETSLVLPNLNRLLNERWRPFMAFSKTDGVRRYWFYHATLAEFFCGQMDRTKLNQTELAMVEELADQTRAAHSRLADRYLAAWGGLAAALPGLKEEGKRDLDDGYGLRHLATHLAAANRGNELHRLAAEGVGVAQPWAAARYSLEGSYAGYLADVDLAWKRAEQECSDDRMKLARAMRYALIAGSVHSLSLHMPAGILGAAVKHRLGHWTPTVALDFISCMSSDVFQALALEAVVPYIDAEQWERAFQIAAGVRPGFYRAMAFAKLLETAPAGKIEVASDAFLSAVVSTVDERVRAQFLVHLASKIPSSQMGRALGIASSLYPDLGGEGIPLLDAMIGLAPHTPESDWPRISYAIGQLKNAGLRADGFSQLAACAPSPLVGGITSAALEAAAESNDAETIALTRVRLAGFIAPDAADDVMQDALESVMAHRRWTRCSTLIQMIPFLSGELRRRAILEAHEEARHERYYEPEYSSMSRLLEYLPSALKRRAQIDIFKEIQGWSDEEMKVRGLKGLGQDLPKPLIMPLWEMVTQLKSEYSRLQAYKELISRPGCAIPRYAMNVAHSFQDREKRAEALAITAEYLAEEVQERVLAEAITTCGVIGDVDMLEMSVQMLNLGSGKVGESTTLAEVVRTALTLETPDYVTRLMTCCGQHLSQTQLLDLMRMLCELGDKPQFYDEWHDAISQVSEFLPPHLVVWSLACMESLQMPENRIHGMVGMIPYLANGAREKVIEEALVSLNSERSVNMRYVASRIGSHLAPTRLRELMLKVLDTINPWTLASIAPFLDENLLYEATVRIWSIEARGRRIALLSALYPFLLQTQKPFDWSRMLAEAETVEPAELQTTSLALLIPFMPDCLTSDLALRILHETPKDYRGHGTLLQIAPWIPIEAIPDMLDAALSIGGRELLIQILKRTTPGWVGACTEDAEHAKEALLRTVRGWRDQPRGLVLTALQQIAPVLYACGGSGLLDETKTAVTNVGRWWP